MYIFRFVFMSFLWEKLVTFFRTSLVSPGQWTHVHVCPKNNRRVAVWQTRERLLTHRLAQTLVPSQTLYMEI